MLISCYCYFNVPVFIELLIDSVSECIPACNKFAEERGIVNGIKAFIDTLDLNGCLEIQKYLILAIQTRSEASVLMCTNYEVYNKYVLVPVTRHDYQQLMRMFGVPFRSVDGRVAAYLVEMHMKQARLVHLGPEESFEWTLFSAMVRV